MNPISRFFARLKFKRAIKTDESVNVVDGMVKARRLYKELSVAAHPDRHPLKKEIAEDIMKRVTANRHNYAGLISLKAEIEAKLK